MIHLVICKWRKGDQRLECGNGQGIVGKEAVSFPQPGGISQHKRCVPANCYLQGRKSDVLMRLDQLEERARKGMASPWVMESQQAAAMAPSSSHPHPVLAFFPLGATLLLLATICISGLFSCCHNREKLQAFAHSLGFRSQVLPPPLPLVHSLRPPHPLPTVPYTPPRPDPATKKPGEEDRLESLPVIMAGDRMPRFMARPCPCQHTMLPLPLPSPRVIVEDARNLHERRSSLMFLAW